jgi:dephospho-CoA kinase
MLNNVETKGFCMDTNKLVIGLAGMPGAGKSLVVEAAQQEGYAVVVMGDVIREETQKRGVPLTPKNIGKVMLELRKTYGNNVIAEKCVPKILQHESRKVIVDGLRIMYEAEVFKANFAKFSLMAVHASPEIRFNRLNRRGRSDDPDRWEVFQERDAREIGVGLGYVIAVADYLIINENSREKAKVKAKETLRRVEEKWMK